jgi:hypothetical protein
MTPWRCAATALLLGAGWGCAASNEPTFALTAISPNMAFNDAPVALTVGGEPFRPTYRFDTMAGAAATEAGTFSVTLTSVPSPALPTPVPIQVDEVKWLSPKALMGMLPARAPAGVYDVTVTDPRGQRQELPRAFTSLGQDQEPPTVTFLSPAPRTIVAAGTTITIILSADDGHGFLDTLDVDVSTDGEPHLLSHRCPVVPSTGQVPCYFPVTSPAPVGARDQIVIRATAVDSVGNLSPVTPPVNPVSFRLAPRPSASGLSPMIGPSRGGTEIIVTGTDFVEPTDDSRGTELLVDGVMVMPEQVAPTQIRAVMPSHDAGVAKVRVVTGSAQTDPPMSFEYVAAPAVRTVSPTHGPVTGGTRIAIAGNHFRDPETMFFAGNTWLDVCFVSDGRVETTMPAGAAPGPVTIFAYDEIGGTGALQAVFTYDPADATEPDLPDAGGLEPMLCPTGVP